jgi:hypothetical protein
LRGKQRGYSARLATGRKRFAVIIRSKAACIGDLGAAWFVPTFSWVTRLEEHRRLKESQCMPHRAQSLAAFQLVPDQPA